MDARGDLSLRVSGGLELNSDGSGWHCYLYPFFSAPAGSRLAAHALPGPAGDSDIPERGVLVPPLHTGQELLHGYLHTFIPPAPAGSWPLLTPASVPADDSDIPGALSPARLPIRHSPGRGVGRPPFCHSSGLGVGRPQCRSTRCRL